MVSMGMICGPMLKSDVRGFRVNNAIFMIQIPEQQKKGLRNKWVNINDLITFLSIRSNSMFISIVINLTLLEFVCLSICMWNLTRRDLREIKVNMSYLVGNDLMNSVSLNSFWL